MSEYTLMSIPRPGAPAVFIPPPTLEANFRSPEDRFNLAYTNHFAPEVRAMVRLDKAWEREAETARLLALPDPPSIDLRALVWKDPATPFITMSVRKANGLKWIRPARLSDLSAFPQFEDHVPYMQDAAPTPDAIPVSLDPAAYAPFGDLAAQPCPFTPWVYQRANGPDGLGVGSIWQANNQVDQDGYGAPWTGTTQAVPVAATYAKFYENGWQSEKIVLWERIK